MQPPSCWGRQAEEPTGLSVPELAVPYEPSADPLSGTIKKYADAEGGVKVIDALPPVLQKRGAWLVKSPIVPS